MVKRHLALIGRPFEVWADGEARNICPKGSSDV